MVSTRGTKVPRITRTRSRAAWRSRRTLLVDPPEWIRELVLRRGERERSNVHPSSGPAHGRSGGDAVHRRSGWVSFRFVVGIGDGIASSRSETRTTG